METLSPSLHCDVTLHQRWFAALLFKPLPSALESLHNQRLLLMYFGVLGSRIGGSVWASDAHSPQNTLIAHTLRACYDVGVGGFYAEPIEQYVGTVTLTMTHCALHILWITGQLEAALNDWLQPSSIHSFVLSCLVRTGGSEKNHNNSDEGVAGAFAAFTGSSEVDVRFTYSALMILLMLQHPNGGSSAVPCDDYELTLDSDVRALVQDFVLRCWSQHEGGFGGLPRSEAHGGMTYCSVASLALLGWWRHNTAQVRSMRRRAIHWCVQRHGCGPVANEETVDDELDHWERVGDGQGFQGRPNKTHDTCYTFWIGCALRILEASEFGMKEDSSLLNDERLSEFVLSCEGPLGGFGRDGQDSDPLHSALGFAGLSCRRGVLGRKLHPVYSTIAQVEGAV